MTRHRVIVALQISALLLCWVAVNLIEYPMP
jgi:hypothetical protein